MPPEHICRKCIRPWPETDRRPQPPQSRGLWLPFSQSVDVSSVEILRPAPVNRQPARQQLTGRLPGDSFACGPRALQAESNPEPLNPMQRNATPCNVFTTR
jgi:hypothetical protein